MESFEKKEKQEKLEFIKKEAVRIIPVLDVLPQKDPRKAEDERLRDEVIQVRNNTVDNLPDTDIEKILERYETRLFSYDKSPTEYNPDAKQVLISASDPANNSLALLEALQSDPRCKGVVLITDNVTGRLYEDSFASKIEKTERTFVPVPRIERNIDTHSSSASSSVLEELESVTAQKPIDVVLAAFESVNSPSATLLFGGKKTLGAKKLYVLRPAWGGPSGRGDLLQFRDALDPFDGMFCIDDIARTMIHKEFPNFPDEKIFTVGSSSIDKLDIGHAAEYEQRGREKLALENDEIAVLYIGGEDSIYKDYNPPLNPNFNWRSFEKTLATMIDVARREPEKKFALLIRPHPRDAKKELLLEPHTDVPSNLRVIAATGTVVDMNEAAYASDIIASIVSNENAFANKRGKPAIYLGYNEAGLGLELLEQYYGKDTVSVIEQQPMISIVHDEAELASQISQYQRENRIHPEQLVVPTKSSIEKMLDIALSPEK